MTEAEAKALSEWFKVRKGKTLKLNDKGIDMVCEALEKQIANKPVGLYKNTCPSCFGIVIRGLEFFCPKCGQKIDEV